MWRYLVGALAACLLTTGAFLLLQSRAAHSGGNATTEASDTQASTGSSLFGGGSEPLRAPEASEKTREQKRFSRYDKDKDGKVELAEYLAARRKNFDKLDTNHDGKLSFAEYAAKAIAKFDAAGGRKGWLSEAEFATTAAVRKSSRRRCSCRAQVPMAEAAPVGASSNSDEEQ